MQVRNGSNLGTMLERILKHSSPIFPTFTVHLEIASGKWIKQILASLPKRHFGPGDDESALNVLISENDEKVHRFALKQVMHQ